MNNYDHGYRPELVHSTDHEYAGASTKIASGAHNSINVDESEVEVVDVPQLNQEIASAP
jgi:hypothetical protein